MRFWKRKEERQEVVYPKSRALPDYGVTMKSFLVQVRAKKAEVDGDARIPQDEKRFFIDNLQELSAALTSVLDGINELRKVVEARSVKSKRWSRLQEIEAYCAVVDAKEKKKSLGAEAVDVVTRLEQYKLDLDVYDAAILKAVEALRLDHVESQVHRLQDAFQSYAIPDRVLRGIAALVMVLRRDIPEYTQWNVVNILRQKLNHLILLCKLHLGFRAFGSRSAARA